MRCDYAFLCDFAEESGGKLHAIGIGWTAIYSSSVPVIHPQLSFVASLSGTIAEAGAKSIELRLIDADGANVIPPIQAQMNLVVQEPALEGRMNLIINLNSLELRQYGEYAFHLVVQGNDMVRAPFSVVAPATTS